VSKLHDIIAETAKERKQMLEAFAREREAWATERASLLDRIQHPGTRQVQQAEPVLHETPKDLAEMAHVGQEVPEFVQVGSDWQSEVNHISEENPDG
jgi:hypothetical protein